MIKFNTCKLDPKILDQWVSTDVNVLLIGEKGVGKSHQIIDTFKRNNLKYAYFSGATLDPWIHLLGIPKAKLQEDGSEKMEFILPENLDNDVEAIFCDEWNRTNKVVRNALLELQQFKSINGRKFPKLRMVWGAVNPPKSDADDSIDYDVDELDPAQLDRFHVIVELPNEPDVRYFKSIFGDYHGKILVDWWKKQSKESLKILSPRRLEYIGHAFKKGLDIKYLLPVSANTKDLVRALSMDETTEMINLMLANPTDEDMEGFLKIDQNFLKYKGKLKETHFWQYYKYINKEFLIDEIKSNIDFEDYAIYQVLQKEPVYRDAVLEISKANPQNTILKIVKSLLEQKYVPDAMQKGGSGGTLKFSINKDISKTDSFNTMWQWKGKRPPNGFDPSDNIYKITTPERRAALSEIRKCYGVCDKKHATNLIISCLISMQKVTLSGVSEFLPLLGSACVYAKENFNDADLLTFVNIIKAHKSKISNNRVEDYIEYLEKGAPNASILPDSFRRKVKDIRSVLSISDDNTDIIDSLFL